MRAHFLLEPKADFSFICLGEEWAETVAQLEVRCHANPWSERAIAAEFEKDVSLRLGIVSEEGLVAYCFSHIVFEELHILNLAVDPSSQRMGWGKLLLGETLRVGVSKGAAFASLEVRESNEKAQKLYSKFGFRPVGMRKNYYQSNRENAVLMDRSLFLGDLKEFQSLAGLPATSLD